MPLRRFNRRRPWLLLSLLFGVVSVAHGKDSAEAEALTRDIADLQERLAGLTPPQGPAGPPGPDGAPGKAGPFGADGTPLTQEQIVELALRTAALEERALEAQLRIEQLNSTLVSLHALTDKLLADADALHGLTP
jgi:hypothetical protein